MTATHNLNQLCLIGRTNNDYFEQIDKGYSARRRRGDRWQQIKPSNYNNYIFVIFCFVLLSFIYLHSLHYLNQYYGFSQGYPKSEASVYILLIEATNF